MTNLSIPTEVLGEIFLFLKKSTLFQCTFVCKSWNKQALRYLYKELNLNSYYANIVKQQLLDTTDNITYFKYGHIVQKLVIQDDRYKMFFGKSGQEDQCEFNEKELILLLEYLPNIQYLHVGNRDCAKKYLEYILNTDSTKCLNYIKEIKHGLEDNQLLIPNNVAVLHSKLCYKYRATVTKLSVFNENIRDYRNTLDNGTFCLSQFANLTYLKLGNNTQNELMLYEIQKVCPHLIYLNYYSAYGISDNNINDILDDLINSKWTRNLKKLILAVPKIQEGYIKYITNCILPQLESIYLSLDGIDFYDWIEDVGMDNALQFASQLSTVKDSKIIFTPSIRYPREFRNKQNKSSIFFEFVNAFKGDKNPICSATFNDSRSLYNSIKYNLKDGLCFEYGLESFDCYQLIDTEETDSIQQNLIDINLHDSIFLKFIHRLYFKIADCNPDFLYKFIEYALIHYPNLQAFRFKSLTYPTTFFLIETNQKSPESINTQDNSLSVIKAINTFPSQDILNLIATYLPSIETFLCEARNNMDTNDSLYEVDFTCLKNLEVFYFDIKVLLCENTIGVLFIHLKYSDGDEGYYYYQNIGHVFALHATTMDFLEECRYNKEMYISSVSIKCNKAMKIVFRYGSLLSTVELENRKIRNKSNLVLLKC